MFSFYIVLLAAVASLFSSNSVVDAHGYTTISRNFKCKLGANYQCGNIVYEPQSLEAPKDFPGAGPDDGQIASAGIGAFSQLDVQEQYRWVKTPVQAGSFDISWIFTANHRTTSWEYYLTKQDWDPNAPLTRASFDLTPFCTVSGGGAQPPFEVTHNCNLPSRTGYQVILAVWTIADTANAFYNMNDVDFTGASPVPPASPMATPATIAPYPVSSPSAPNNNGSVCASGAALEAVDDCTAFVYCVNGAPLPNSRVPCAPGLLFSNTLQNCDWPDNVVDCERLAGPAPSTNAPVASPTADAPAPSPTTNAPVASPVATASPVASPATATPVVVTSAPVPSSGSSICSSGKALAAVDQCTAFVYCVNGAELPNSKVPCAEGLLFNNAIQNCDWPYNVNCD